MTFNTSWWVDEKYIGFAMSRLDRGRKIADGKYNSRCPICGDSQKSLSKARFHISKQSDGGYLCGCFNCGYVAPFWKFLKDEFPDYYSEYQKEKFVEDNSAKKDPLSNEQIKGRSMVNPKIKRLFKPSISSLKTDINKAKDTPTALKYLNYRKIPENKMGYFIHVWDYQKLVKNAGYVDWENVVPEPRLVIPLINHKREITGFVGRSYEKDAALRYVTIKITDDFIFVPLDIDFTKPVYVFEGIFDALMVNNAVAVLSSNLERAEKILPECELVLCYDNEPRNKEIMKKMGRSALRKFSLFVPDDKMTHKDMNEWVSSGVSPSDVCAYIESRSFKYPKSLLEYKRYNKS